jgi:hypothetical protein
MRESNALIDLSDEITKPIESAFIINTLNKQDTLNEISEVWHTSNEIIEYANDFIKLIDQIIENAKNNNISMLENSILKLLSRQFFSNWIFLMIISDKLKISKIPEDSNIRIPTIYSPENDGSIWLDFPGSAIIFGASFDKEKLFMEKCQPFIDIISHMYTSGLENAFTQIKSEITHEVSIAKDVNPLTKKILDENSNWSVHLYMANLGKNPFLVQTTSILHVQDEIGAKYEEECDLAFFSTDENGSSIMNKSFSPLIVGSEGDSNFAFITKNVQGSMKRGKAFRDAFTSGAAKCWIKFSIEKVGIFRIKTLLTPKADFKS